MTNTTTNSQAPEILAKQVAEWRKEVARLNDLIAHAEGRDSQAASIADDNEFHDALMKWLIDGDYHIEDGALICKGWDGLIACLDAKLAQAWNDGDAAGMTMMRETIQKSLSDEFGVPYIEGPEQTYIMIEAAIKEKMEALLTRAEIAEDAWRAEKARADEAEEWLETEKAFSHSQEKERIAAESRLAEIRRGVEGAEGYWRNAPHYDEVGSSEPQKEFFLADDIRALLQPQGQADTSGLPG